MPSKGRKGSTLFLQRKTRWRASTLRPTDSQRIVRALEVFDTSGRSIVEWQRETGRPLIDSDDARKIVIEPDRQWLGERIASRFGMMMKGGAMDEVKALLSLGLSPDLPAMRAIGVREIAEVLAGRLAGRRSRGACDNCHQAICQAANDLVSQPAWRRLGEITLSVSCQVLSLRKVRIRSLARNRSVFSG